jgi:hypothetical protein
MLLVSTTLSSVGDTPARVVMGEIILNFLQELLP